MHKKNNLEKNTILLTIGTFLNKGLQFILIPFFSRWLSTEDYGTYDLYVTYITLLIPIITLACGDAIFRFGVDKDSKDEKSKYISNGASIIFLNLFLSTIFVFIIYLWKGWEYALPFACLLVVDVFNNFLQGTLRALRRLDIYSFCTAISTCFTAIFVFVLVKMLNMGLAGMLYGYAIGGLIGNMIIAAKAHIFSYIKFSSTKLKTVKELISYSYALIPNNVGWWVINASDRMIINLLWGAKANGIYAIAAKIPNFCTALFSVFNISWQEAATDAVDSKTRNEYYTKVYNQMVTVLVSLCAGIICCNFIFFGYIFDDKYMDAANYVPLLITSAVFGAVAQFYGGIQISLKHPKANGVTTAIAAVLNVLLHFALAKMMGLYAAAISTLVSHAFLVYIRKILLRKKVSIKLSKKTNLLLVIYGYFCVASYYKHSIWFHLLNLCWSGIVFIFFNKEMLKKYLKKAFSIFRGKKAT